MHFLLFILQSFINTKNKYLFHFIFKLFSNMYYTHTYILSSFSVKKKSVITLYSNLIW